MIKRVLSVVVPLTALAGVIAIMVIAASGASMPLIDTKGQISGAQRDTLFRAVAIMLIIVLPVFLLTFFIAVRYRATNKKAVYKPQWASNKLLETIWWGVPILIVMMLSVLAWKTSHSLDPYRPLSSSKPPLRIQVVALQWKWLFIYPNEQVASIGELAMPVNTPVEFTITSDAPMNSFWIPQLGGQIYAVAGMSRKLHLNAYEPGDYRGYSANLSGEGHASMTFTVKARNENDFHAWLTRAGQSKQILSSAVYEDLRQPSKNNAVTYYRIDSTKLFDKIIARYSSYGEEDVSMEAAN